MNAFAVADNMKGDMESLLLPVGLAWKNVWKTNPNRSRRRSDFAFSERDSPSSPWIATVPASGRSMQVMGRAGRAYGACAARRSAQSLRGRSERRGVARIGRRASRSTTLASSRTLPGQW